MTGFRTFVAALLAFGPSVALAQETGIYVGAAVGSASYHEVCHDASLLINAEGAIQCLHKEDTGSKLFGGWRFHRYFAAELSYIDFGSVSAPGAIGGVPVTSTTKAKAFGVSALGILPLGDRLSIVGRLGVQRSRVETDIEGAATKQEDKNDNELHVGIGGTFQLSRGWALRAEYERMNQTRIDLTTIGAQYRF